MNTYFSHNYCITLFFFADVDENHNYCKIHIIGPSMNMSSPPPKQSVCRCSQERRIRDRRASSIHSLSDYWGKESAGLRHGHQHIDLATLGSDGSAVFPESREPETCTRENWKSIGLYNQWQSDAISEMEEMASIMLSLGVRLFVRVAT